MPTHDSLAAEPGQELPTIHLVDDDAMVRSALGRLFTSRSYEVRTYANAQEFLACFDGGITGCLILDFAMPGVSGLELLLRLQALGEHPPAVFLSGLADVRTCAQALRNGAVHFLTKPVDETQLFQAVEEAVRRDTARREASHQRARVASRLNSLTPREREVLAHVMRGRLNKQIAADLGTAEKTVKVHRARAMEKMGVRSVAALVRMVEQAHLEAAEARLERPGPGRDGSSLAGYTIADSAHSGCACEG